MFVWQLLSVLLFGVCFYFLWKRRRFYLLMRKIRGPLGYPFLGIGLELSWQERFLPVIGDYFEKYGSVFLSWLGITPFLFVSDPQILQEVMTSPKCLNKGLFYKSVIDGAGPALVNLNDPPWSLHRRSVNPAFGHKVLLSFFPIFNKETGLLLKIFDNLVDNGAKDLTQHLQSSMMRVATQSTMGVDKVDDSILQSYQCVFETVAAVNFSPWLRFKKIRKLLGKDDAYCRAKSEIHNFVTKQIEKKTLAHSKETEQENQSEEKNIFINLAIDLQRRGIFSWKEVEYETSIMVFGAFETTANTVGYALSFLSMYPEYQEKVFEELLALFPNSGDFEVTYEDLQNMVYLDLILNETIRLIPAIPVVFRKTTQDFELSNGIVLPRGIEIVIDIFHVHRNKKIWGEDADKFNPDHFLPQNFQEKHPYAYIPFSKGIRNCIGWRYALLSAKLTLAKLLRNYKFSTNFKYEDLHFVDAIVMHLKNTPLLELQKRN